MYLHHALRNFLGFKYDSADNRVVLGESSPLTWFAVAHATVPQLVSSEPRGTVHNRGKVAGDYSSYDTPTPYHDPGDRPLNAREGA